MYYAWVPKDWESIILFNPNKVPIKDRLILKYFDSILDCLEFVKNNYDRYKGNLKWDRKRNENIIELSKDVGEVKKSVLKAEIKQLSFLE